MRKLVTFFVKFFTILVVILFLTGNFSTRAHASSAQFYCLGSCPTKTPTVSPPVLSPTVQLSNNSGAQSTVHTEVVQTQGTQNGPIANLISYLQYLLNLLYQLIGVGTPPVTPAPTPTTIPAPTAIISPAPTGMPGMDATPLVPNSINIADIKYVPGNEPLKVFNLTAEVEGNNWTFNGTVPGPEIRVNQGDHVQVNVLNLLPEGLTIHWHGLVLPASQDGVPGVTQNAIPSGGTYQYNFVATDPGTYWYHTHQDTLNELPKGLFGPLIIVPQTQTFPTTRDYNVIYDNVNASTSGVMNNLYAAPGDTVRLRILNAFNGDFSGMQIEAALLGAPFKVIALDGHDINDPQYVQNQQLPIGMAQRVDIEFTMPQSGSVELLEQSGEQSWTLGQGPVNNLPANINTLPQFNYMNYGLPTTDSIRSPSGNYDINYNMTIGENLSINGQLFPNVPDLVVHEGQYVHIHITNDSNTTHAMHLHGHVFTVLAVNNQQVTGSPIHLDTILVPPFTTEDIAFQADDPGIWMLHCHVLPHAAAGLMMMVRYDNVYTPYSIAPGSGNIPE